MTLEERDAEILARRARGEGAADIARALGVNRIVVYRVWKRDPLPDTQAALYFCDGCGREVRGPAGQETIPCPYCDAQAWRPMSDREMLARLSAAVAQLEGKR